MRNSVDHHHCNSSDAKDLMNIFFLHYVFKHTEKKKSGRRRFKRRPRPRWIHRRLHWEEHLRKLHHEQKFDRTYRMSYSAYCKLLDLLRDDLMTACTGQRGGYADTDSMEPELIMAIGIRWLAGGSYIDIRHVYGCSVASVFRFRDMFLDAVLNCKELDIAFPDTDEDLTSTVSKFAIKSSERIMKGCVGAINGLFVKI
jgi:hypothetical protein